MENERVMNDGLHLFAVYGSLFMCSLSSSVGCQMPENKLELTVSALTRPRLSWKTGRLCG